MKSICWTVADTLRTTVAGTCPSLALWPVTQLCENEEALVTGQLIGAAGGDAGNAAAPGASQAQLPNGASTGADTGSAVGLSSHPSAVALSGQALPSQGPDSSRGPSEEPDQGAGQQPWSYSAEPSRAQSMDLDGGSEAEAHVPRPGSGRRPKYVTPVDELDNSDVESAQVRTLLLPSMRSSLSA